MNHIGIDGNLCQDPDLRFTPQGTPVCDLRLANTDKYTTSDGQKKEETLFVDVTFWGKKAEVVAEYHQKGDRILVEGKLKMDEWTQDGQNRSKLEIKGRDFTFIKQRRSDGGGGGRGQAQSTATNNRGNRSQSAQNAPSQQANQTDQADQGGTPEDGYEVNDDEIPF